MTRKASGWRTTRGTRQERGYGAEWQKLRAFVLSRDKNLCQPCKRKGRVTPAREVDHITPKANGGTDEPDNLAAICTPCHRAKTTQEAAQAQGRTVKPRLEFDARGFPVWPEGR